MDKKKKSHTDQEEAGGRRSRVASTPSSSCPRRVFVAASPPVPVPIVMRMSLAACVAVAVVCLVTVTTVGAHQMSAMELLKRDMETLNCLFFRRCHLADLSHANRVFERVMSRPGSGRPGNVVRLEVFMEAQCPDTSRFVRAQLMPAWKKLGGTGRVEWNLIPFGKARCQEKANGDFECTCQHGPNECILNQLMNCVIEKIGHPDRYMETIDCIQGTPNLDSALDKCIAPSQLFSLKQMHECASGPHGRRLLAIAGAKTASLNPRLNFVPWIMLDGERVVDALYALQDNLCKRLEPAPLACSN